MQVATRQPTLLSPAEEARLDREVVESLRRVVAERKASIQEPPTVKQVSTVVRCVRQGRTLAFTAVKSGLSQEAVLDVVSEFGTWLVHSLRPTVQRPSWQLSLFETGSETMAGVPLGGFEPWAPHRRDIANALAAIAATDPGTETVSRFVSRTYAPRTATLTYPLIVGVWGQVIRDRLAGIELVSEDLAFLGLAVDAYDLLDVARADGVSAVWTLANASSDNLDEVVSAAAIGGWLAEGPMRSIARAAELARSNTAAKARLDKELSHFAAAVYARPEDFLPEGVRHLTLGHVQRICTASGVRIETENRREEAEIRAVLRDMGLAADADLLVRDAVRLAEAGQLDEFWEVMATRVDGDPSWVEQLAALVTQE